MSLSHKGYKFLGFFMKGFTILALSLSLLPFGQSVAIAENLFSHTTDAQGMAKAFALTASATSTQAAAANPAALINEKGASVSLSVGVSKDFLTINQQSSHLPTHTAYQIAGAAKIPLPKPLDDHLFFGIQAQLPNDNLYQLSLPKENEPVALFYGNQQRRLSLFTALGLRLWKDLSIGLGFSLLPLVSGTVNIDFQEQTQNSTIDIDVKASFAPTLGVYWKPLDSLELGFNYRAGHRSTVSIPVNIHISEELPNIFAQVDGYAFGLPHSLSLGASYQFIPNKLKLNLDIAYDIFKHSPLSAPVITLFDTEGNKIEASSPAIFKVDNRWKLRTSLQYRALPALELILGYAFHQSPVPNQNAVTNLLDAHMHRLSFGFGYKISHSSLKPLQFELSTALALDILGKRSFEKLAFLPQNPGFPNISLDGGAFSWIFTGKIHFD